MGKFLSVLKWISQIGAVITCLSWLLVIIGLLARTYDGEQFFVVAGVMIVFGIPSTLGSICIRVKGMIATRALFYRFLIPIWGGMILIFVLGFIGAIFGLDTL
jgi:hypothetical protein